VNEIQLFENAEFGAIRTLDIDGNVWFVGSDIAKALAYTNPSKALKDHCRYITKRSIPHPQGNGTLEVNTIPEGDLYRLVAKSELPAAEKFESWVFDEVLPTSARQANIR
jgi:anti-repressor protein